MLLLHRCCEALRQLKAIPTTYRMTSKPTPFRPSPYAGALLNPLHTFLEASSTHSLRRTVRSSIAQARSAWGHGHRAYMLPALPSLHDSPCSAHILSLTPVAGGLAWIPTWLGFSASAISPPAVAPLRTATISQPTQEAQSGPAHWCACVPLHPSQSHAGQVQPWLGWVRQEVVAEVAARFGAMATELLEQLQKTETSLMRLKKARGPDAAAASAAPGGAPQLSDIDKMTLQLFLDVQVGCLGGALADVGPASSVRQDREVGRGSLLALQPRSRTLADLQCSVLPRSTCSVAPDDLAEHASAAVRT